MPWEFLSASGYEVGRLVLQRGIALVYGIAFLCAYNQFPALLGERGLLPVPSFVAATRFRRNPSLFYWRYSDRLLRGCCVLGMAVSGFVLVGGLDLVPLWVTPLIWLVPWILYLSIVNVGQTFYSFGWESLLLEAGFLVAFSGNRQVTAPLVVMWAFRWLLFRLEFGAGMIKMRGDPCWRRLTCLDYHHETQPMPNPLSWWFHHLPKPLHRIEVLANHFTQLVAPWGLFLPQPISGTAAVLMVVTQAYLMLSGNYSWLNALTLIVAMSVLPDTLWGVPPGAAAGYPTWFGAVSIGLGLLVLALSPRPALNLFSRRQLMNFAFNRLHLVNAYGAFGSVTKRRYEVVLEGADESGEWREYEFKGKPGDPGRRPPQVAPYHLRLDWLMWFVALSPDYGRGWFTALLGKLLVNDPATLGLLARNPFPDHPPRLVRARYYLYRFTTWEERRRTGRWWHRELVGELVPPTALG
ncbi:MAG: membrane protein [Acidimicrobiia bacterium]|nr:MAG: membrane protein [Acidimicrobiia bacterium]